MATRTVIWPAKAGQQPVIINAEDFDPAVHHPWLAPSGETTGAAAVVLPPAVAPEPPALPRRVRRSVAE